MTLNDTLTTQYFGNYLTSLISKALSPGLCQYRWLGVPRQRESVYVTSTLNTLSAIHGRRHIGGPFTTHRRLAPLPKEPSRTSLMYLIFLETRIIHLHFPPTVYVYLYSIFSGGRRNFPQDFCISKRRAFQPFKVIQGR